MKKLISSWSDDIKRKARTHSMYEVAIMFAATILV